MVLGHVASHTNYVCELFMAAMGYMAQACTAKMHHATVYQCMGM